MWAKDGTAIPAKAKEHDYRVASLNNVLFMAVSAYHVWVQSTLATQADF